MTRTSSPTDRERNAREYLAERAARKPNLTPSRTYGNATTEGYYTGPNIGTSRDGANDFQLINSAPMAGQIRRSAA